MFKTLFLKLFPQTSGPTTLDVTNAIRWEREEALYPKIFGCKPTSKAAKPSSNLLSIFFNDIDDWDDSVSIQIFPPCLQRDFWVYVTSGLTDTRSVIAGESRHDSTYLGFELFVASDEPNDYAISILLRLAIYQICVITGRRPGRVISCEDRIPLDGLDISDSPDWAFSLIVHAEHKFPQRNSLGDIALDLYQLSVISEKEYGESVIAGTTALLKSLKKRNMLTIPKSRLSIL